MPSCCTSGNTNKIWIQGRRTYYHPHFTTYYDVCATIYHNALLCTETRNMSTIHTFEPNTFSVAHFLRPSPRRNVVAPFRRYGVPKHYRPGTCSTALGTCITALGLHYRPGRNRHGNLHDRHRVHSTCIKEDQLEATSTTTLLAMTTSAVAARHAMYGAASLAKRV